jgi:hypothetical protein
MIVNLATLTIVFQPFPEKCVFPFQIAFGLGQSLLPYLKGFIEFEGNKLEISLGSTLPFYDNGVIEIDNKKGVFTGNAVFVPREFNSENVISTSKLCLDIPYLWGGKNALGYDCSGFVQVVYKALGIKLPRDSRQ